jgi:hypothetical protein
VVQSFERPTCKHNYNGNTVYNLYSTSQTALTSFKFSKDIRKPYVLLGVLSSIWQLEFACFTVLQVVGKAGISVCWCRLSTHWPTPGTWQTISVIWFVRYNDELYKLHKANELVTYLHIKRFKWAGNIVQMLDNSIPKWTLEESLRGCKPIGKPRNRCKNEVGKDCTPPYC